MDWSGPVEATLPKATEGDGSSPNDFGDPNGFGSREVHLHQLSSPSSTLVRAGTDRAGHRLPLVNLYPGCRFTAEGGADGGPAFGKRVQEGSRAEIRARRTDDRLPQ